MKTEKRYKIYTIGHSIYPIETLIHLLLKNDVECLADVRRFPTSKQNPQFNKENFLDSLQKSGIEYRWLGELLGGFRTGGYEAFMTSNDFNVGLRKLKNLAHEKLTAVMCAELSYLRCHRRFIAERLTRDNWLVLHMLNKGEVVGHQQELL